MNGIYCVCGHCNTCETEVSDDEIQVVATLTTEKPVEYHPERKTLPYLPSFSPHFADKDAAETDLS